MTGKKKIIYRVDGEEVKRPYKCLACPETSYYTNHRGATSHRWTKHKPEALFICDKEFCVNVVSRMLPGEKHCCLLLKELEPDVPESSETISKKKKAVITLGY